MHNLPDSSDALLDDLDHRILIQLQTDASLTNFALAERVHASPPTTLRRVKRLTELGVIEKTVAIVSPQKLGAGLTAIVEVALDVQTAEKLAEFEALAQQDTAVTQCYRVAGGVGGTDFILVLQVADMPAYHATVHRLFTQQANVRNMRAFFSTHRAKFETRLPQIGR
jgi:Lrp/AsnC family transcriptional regulator, leucine-responsive regulatory protein